MVACSHRSCHGVVRPARRTAARCTTRPAPIFRFVRSFAVVFSTGRDRRPRRDHGTGRIDPSRFASRRLSAENRGRAARVSRPPAINRARRRTTETRDATDGLDVSVPSPRVSSAHVVAISAIRFLLGRTREIDRIRD